MGTSASHALESQRAVDEVRIADALLCLALRTSIIVAVGSPPFCHGTASEQRGRCHTAKTLLVFARLLLAVWHLFRRRQVYRSSAACRVLDFLRFGTTGDAVNSGAAQAIV